MARFNFETKHKWWHDTSQLIMAELHKWWHDDRDQFGAMTAQEHYVNTGRLVAVIEPGDGTSYQVVLTNLVGYGIPGAPPVALAFLNTYRSAASFGPVTLDPDGQPWDYSVSEVASKLRIDGRTDVCGAAHVASMLLGLACAEQGIR